MVRVCVRQMNQSERRQVAPLSRINAQNLVQSGLHKNIYSIANNICRADAK